MRDDRQPRALYGGGFQLLSLDLKDARSEAEFTGSIAETDRKLARGHG